MGILRTAEDSRPLVHSSSPSSSSSSSQTISDGYVNEGICSEAVEANVVFNKFGDSCQRTLVTKATVEGSPRYNHSIALYPQAGPTGASIPLRNDCLSLKEQHELKGTPWFQAGIPREISLEVLSRQNPGAFLVRQSTTKPGCFALSLRVPPPAPKVAHYLILRTIRGYKIKVSESVPSRIRQILPSLSVLAGLHQGIQLAAGADNAPLCDARVATGSAGSASTPTGRSTTRGSRNVRFTERVSENYGRIMVIES